MDQVSVGESRAVRKPGVRGQRPDEMERYSSPAEAAANVCAYVVGLIGAGDRKTIQRWRSAVSPDRAEWRCWGARGGQGPVLLHLAAHQCYFGGGFAR